MTCFSVGASGHLAWATGRFAGNSELRVQWCLRETDSVGEPGRPGLGHASGWELAAGHPRRMAAVEWPGTGRDGIGAGGARNFGGDGHRRGDLVLFCCGDRTGTGLPLDHQLSDPGRRLRRRHGTAGRTLGLGAFARAAADLDGSGIDSGPPSRLITPAQNVSGESAPRRPRRDDQ